MRARSAHLRAPKSLCPATLQQDRVLGTFRSPSWCVSVYGTTPASVDHDPDERIGVGTTPDDVAWETSLSLDESIELALLLLPAVHDIDPDILGEELDDATLRYFGVERAATDQSTTATNEGK